MSTNDPAAFARLGNTLPFPSRNWRRDTLHTASFAAREARPGDAILDVGCGSGFLPALFHAAGWTDVWGVDIMDMRRAPFPHFELFDGLHLPFADGRFDLVTVNFVLHHVPNDKKLVLLREIKRVTRRTVVILEDTPRTFIDRWVSRRHGEEFCKRVGSTEPFGFYTKEEWDSVLTSVGFGIARSERIGRLSRNWRQPYARSVFVLEVPSARPAA
jgi:SAM-dependent methyltransferase